MSDLTLFAETTFRNQYRKFGIKTDDRRRHMYLIGKTGMGKSTILENMIVEDIRQGRGIAVVDPHGDLAEKIIQYVPAYRVKDVIYFNPSDNEHPIAFNVVEQVAPHMRHLVASGLIGVFQKLWADSWGPRLEYILRNTILAILDYPNSTLLSITRMLSDKSFRKKVIEKIQDPVVKSFWVKEFAGYADKFASEAVSPIQNKVGQFLSSSLIRNIVGQVKSSIDIRQVMDEGKILVMNLSKGRIGEDNSELLGSMMITKIQLAAMSRVDMHEEERKDFYLYVDEFQNFATDSFANILSEARKYRLNLIMGHQYIEQLSDEVRAAVFGNVGTLVVFRVGATDAEELVKEFTPVFTEEDLVNLPKYNMCLKLMIDGVASDPFSARGLPPLTQGEKTGQEQAVIEYTRHNFANNRPEVENLIMRWHDEDEGEGPAPTTIKGAVPQSRQDAYRAQPSPNAPRPTPPFQQYSPQTYTPPVAHQNRSAATYRPDASAAVFAPAAATAQPSQPLLDPSVYKYEAICSRCNKPTRVPFKPDGVRPVFCKDCLAIMRQENESALQERKNLKQREIEQLSNQATRILNSEPFQSSPRPAPSAAPLPAQPFQSQPQNPIKSQPQSQFPSQHINPSSAPQTLRQAPSSSPRPQTAGNRPTSARPSAPVAEAKSSVAASVPRSTSFSPFQPVIEEAAPPAAGLSLRDLASRPAVDFKGRPLPAESAAPAQRHSAENQVSPLGSLNPNEAPSSTTNQIAEPSSQANHVRPLQPGLKGGTLNAGQPVRFPPPEL